jgi:hypothetical protein
MEGTFTALVSPAAPGTLLAGPHPTTRLTFSSSVIDLRSCSGLANLALPLVTLSRRVQKYISCGCIEYIEAAL